MGNNKGFNERYVNKYEGLEKKLSITIKNYGTVRLIIAIIAIIGAIAFYKIRREDLFVINLVVMVTIFTVVALKHSKLIDFKKEVTILKKINETEIKRIQGDFADLEDTGEEYKDQEHNYCDDLDIFGKASLFQWMNSCVTSRGRNKLSSILKGNLKFTSKEIYERQEAIKELGGLNHFRQRLQGKALINEKKLLKDENFIQWGKEKNKNIEGFFIGVLYLDSIATIGLFIASIFNIISWKFFMMMIILNVFILKFNEKNLNLTLDTVGAQYKGIVSYKEMLRLIERRQYKSQLLKSLKSKVKNRDWDGYKELTTLAKLAESIEDRKNALYLLLNVFFFLDFHYYNKLNKWKKKSGDKIEVVVEVIGTFEELSSFGAILANYDGFNFPEIKDEFCIKAHNVRHPLLGKKSIGNNINLDNKGESWLITGSNMAGKSTYLRTIGVNLVLAYSGGPVMAENFCCNIMEIYTCMRIGDNLEKSISSFYAEILRVKSIIKNSKEGRKVFYLLDEIFKGTNSRDRHKGAEILINELTKLNTLGLVSTHDLELGDIQNPKVSNYHFEEYYEEDNIKFDYKLKKGISTTQNALYLMRMAGIDC